MDPPLKGSPLLPCGKLADLPGAETFLKLSKELYNLNLFLFTRLKESQSKEESMVHSFMYVLLIINSSTSHYLLLATYFMWHGSLLLSLVL